MSMPPRLFVSVDLLEGDAFSLEEGQAHYLTRVMRLRTGDHARLFNGRHGEWLSTLEMTGKAVSVRPTRQSRRQPDSAGTLELLFAPLKKTRTDFAIEKATELGATHIRPVITTRTQTQRIKVERLQSIVQEAAEQTERMDLPTVYDLATLETALGTWDPTSPLIYCDEAGDDPRAPWGGEGGRAPSIAELLCTLKSRKGGVLIGPEGGFTEDERAVLKSLDFVHAVSLGPRILRAETAIVSALTIWQSVLGDWR